MLETQAPTFPGDLDQRASKHPDHECGCPAWVVACAHFERRVLIIDDGDAYPSTQRHRGLGRRKRFAVGNHAERYRCDCCGQMVFMISASSTFLQSDDLDAAKAEFTSRSLALMRRSEVPHA